MTDIVEEQDAERQCCCDHLEKDHSALGCSRCDCLWFETWEELDARRITEGYITLGELAE